MTTLTLPGLNLLWVFLFALLPYQFTSAAAAVVQLEAVDAPASSNLTEATWTAEIRQHDIASNRDIGQGARELRREYFTLNFQGADGATGLVTGIESDLHQFDNNACGKIPSVPGLGLSLSTLHLTDDSVGVRLNVDPTQSAKFARCFEGIDSAVGCGHNVYSRSDLVHPDCAHPMMVTWDVTRVGIVDDPPGILSRDSAGNWVPLQGKFMQWNVHIRLSGQNINVADYFLPESCADHIMPVTAPFCASTDYAGGDQKALDAEQTWVRYSDMRVAEGHNWFPIARAPIRFRFRAGHTFKLPTSACPWNRRGARIREPVCRWILSRTTCFPAISGSRDCRTSVKSVSEDQIVCQVPTDITGPSATECVTRKSGEHTRQSTVVTLPVAPCAPGLYPAVDGSLIGLFRTATDQDIDKENPAQPGEIVACSGEGFGIGMSPVTITVDGLSAQVLSAGLRPGAKSAWRVIFKIPEIVHKTSEVVVYVGCTNSASVTLPIGPEHAVPPPKPLKDRPPPPRLPQRPGGVVRHPNVKAY